MHLSTIAITNLLVVIFIDWEFKDQLFSLNHDLVLLIQKEENSFISIIFSIITQLGYSPAIISVLLLFFLIFPNKIYSISNIIYVIFCSYVLSILKLVYMDPRPYFIYDDIKGYGCDSEFGKPSGHALVSVIIYFLIVDGYLKQKFQNSFTSSEQLESLKLKNKSTGIQLQKQQKEDLPLSQNINNLSSYEGLQLNRWQMYVYLIVMFLIGFSRVYMGVHSFNQIILGWSYGFTLISLYLDYFQDNLNCLVGKYVYKTFNDQQEFNSHKIILSILYLICILLANLVYLHSVNTVSQMDLDIWQREVLKCNNHMKLQKFAYNKCYIDCGTISIVYGILISLLHTKGEYTPENFTDEFRNLRISFKFLRIIILLVVVGLPLLILKKFVHFENMLALFLVKSIIGYLICMFAFIKLVPFIYYKFGLSIKGDLLRYQNQYSFFDLTSKQQDFLKEDYL